MTSVWPREWLFTRTAGVIRARHGPPRYRAAWPQPRGLPRRQRLCAAPLGRLGQAEAFLVGQLHQRLPGPGLARSFTASRSASAATTSSPSALRRFSCSALLARILVCASKAARRARYLAV